MWGWLEAYFSRKAKASRDASVGEPSPPRPCETREQGTEALWIALIEGEESGIAGPFDLARIKRAAQASPGWPRREPQIPLRPASR